MMKIYHKKYEAADILKKKNVKQNILLTMKCKTQYEKIKTYKHVPLQILFSTAMNKCQELFKSVENVNTARYRNYCIEKYNLPMTGRLTSELPIRRE